MPLQSRVSRFERLRGQSGAGCQDSNTDNTLCFTEGVGGRGGEKNRPVEDILIKGFTIHANPIADAAAQ